MSFYALNGFSPLKNFLSVIDSLIDTSLFKSLQNYHLLAYAYTNQLCNWGDVFQI